MMGLIHVVFFNRIRAKFGQEKLNEVLTSANIPLDNEYHIHEHYSDQQWQQLVANSTKVLNLSAEQLLDEFTDEFSNDALRRFPKIVAASNNSFEFLLRQPAIHNSFAAGVRDPKLSREIKDKFNVIQNGDTIILYYRSRNKLCLLYKKLANWWIQYFKDSAQIVEKTCMNHGDNQCEIHVEYSKINHETKSW